jgi:hypothetical protein
VIGTMLPDQPHASTTDADSIKPRLAALIRMTAEVRLAINSSNFNHEFQRSSHESRRCNTLILHERAGKPNIIEPID